jgi:hypothetical protein
LNSFAFAYPKSLYAKSDNKPLSAAFAELANFSKVSANLLAVLSKVYDAS